MHVASTSTQAPAYPTASRYSSIDARTRVGSIWSLGTHTLWTLSSLEHVKVIMGMAHILSFAVGTIIQFFSLMCQRKTVSNMLKNFD